MAVNRSQRQNLKRFEMARKLARSRSKGGKRSLREAELAAAGPMTKSGNAYAPTAIKLMLGRVSLYRTLERG